MSPRARAIVAVAAALLVAALLRDRAREAERPAPVTPASAARSPAPAPPPPGPRPPEPEAATPPAKEPRKDGEPLPAAWIEVAVADADGRPVDRDETIEAYALPAGGRGTDDLDAIPHARVDGDGAARIPVQVPGRFDVGIRSELDRGLHTDVEVTAGSTARVAFRLDRRGTAVFRLRHEPPAGRVFLAGVALEGGTGGEAPLYAGRDDPVGRSLGFEWEDMAKPLSVDLPEGIEFRWRIDARERVEEPPGSVGHRHPAEHARPSAGTTRAGGEVEVALLRPALLRLRIRTEPAVPAGCALRMLLRLHQEGGSEESWFGSDVDAARECSEFATEVQGLPGPATLRWRGSPPEPGYVGVDLPEGILDGISLADEAPVEKEILLRIDPGPALQALMLRQPVRLDVRLPDGSPARADQVHVYPVEPPDPSGETPGWGRYLGFPRDGPVEIPAPTRESFTRLIAFQGPWLASGLLPFPATETLRADLHPSGLLRVEWDGGAPAEDTGSVEIRRVDGGLLLTSCLRENGGWELDEVGPPARWRPDGHLGPLPEGTHAFEVRLGGVRLPDATAVVKAGRVEVLRIRTREE